MARNDPFLTDVEARADYKSTSPFSGWTRREHLVTREVALLVFVPWICYVLLLLVFALPPPGVFASVFALICWAGTLLAAGTSHDLQKRHGSPFYKLLTLTVLLSCTAGPLAGHHIFVTEMSSYWMHQSGVTYKGVAPSSSPDAYQDAGIIDFSDGSNLDLRRVLGSRPVGSTTTYCIAPIMDSSASKRVHFFAADVDCCEPRRSFACGDAAKPSARTGVVLPAHSSSYNAERWQHFYNAAAQAAEVYGWNLPERPIFVRWFDDAEAVQSALLHRGLVEAFIQCFVGLCASSIVAMWLHWSLTYYARDAESKKQTSRRVHNNSCC
mmetsp:Transcript_71132/g.156989  ORF Transcript_71132/g.156989 Transcript_71132/m.156989 type:complete len:325 (+) Transcript_71132:61-1035(+)